MINANASNEHISRTVLREHYKPSTMGTRETATPHYHGIPYFKESAISYSNHCYFKFGK